MTTDTTAPAAPAPEPRRKSPLRVVKAIVVLLLLLIIVGGVLLYMNLNRLVRKTVVSQSSAQLNVPTALQAADVSIFGGKVSLTKFDVGSPQGFNAPQMMSLGGVSVGVKLSELRDDPIRVNEINIKDPKLVIEMQGKEFNIKKFVDALPTGEPKPADQPEKPPLKLIINNLKVEGAQVVFKPDLQAISALPGIGQSLGGLKQEYVLSIPPLDMQNVGTGEGNQNGAAIKDIVTMLVQQLAAKATQSEQLPPELRQLLSLNVDQLTEMAKQKVAGIAKEQLDKAKAEISKKIGGEAGKAIGDVLNNPDATKDPGKAIQQGIGGLLGGKDKKKESAPATKP